MSGGPRPTLAQSLAVFIPGLVITALSAGRATAAFSSADAGLALAPMVALCVGAVLFAVGGMMTLVVIVRPLFGARPQDAAAERLSQKKNGR